MKKVQTIGLDSEGAIENVNVVNIPHVIVDSSALPTGAATSANQVTEITSLASIDGKLNSLGQKVMASSVPVVIASDQSTIPVTNTPSGTQDVNLTKVGGTAVTLGAKPSASSIPVVLATDEAALPVTGTFFQATQPVSIAATVTVTGPLTDAQLRATPVPVSGIVAITGASSSLDIVEEIQTTGFYQGKIGYVFNLIGQRNGFTSTSVHNGIKEYDNAVADFAVTSNSTLDIISSSANDAAAGTGVRTVKVTYINNSNNLVESAAITLNGTTLVTSVLTGVNQVLWMETATAGSGGVAAGNIRLRINGGTVEVEQISAQNNKSRSSITMVPTGYTGYVSDWRTSTVNNDQAFVLLGQVNTLDRTITTGGIYHAMASQYTAINTNTPSSIQTWFKIPALAKVKISTVSAGTASTVRANTNVLFVLIQN